MDIRSRLRQRVLNWKVGAVVGVALVVAGVVFFVSNNYTQQGLQKKQEAACNYMGRTQNADGSYTFAKLRVDGSGMLVDETGCEVYLLGGQGPQIGRDKGVYTISSPGDFGYIAKLNQTVPMNLLRVPFNPDDWNNNPYLAPADMGYQDLLKLYIKAIEAQGDFVELDRYKGQSVDTEIQALTAMAAYFANDPAVIFDVRNEGVERGETDPLADDNAWLNALQAANPDVIKMTYNRYTQDMMAGKRPFFTQSNLLMDAHVYSGYQGTNPETGWNCNEPNRQWQKLLSTQLLPQIAYLQQHHAGFIINEWGGCYNEPTYNTAIMNFALQNHLAGLSYFFPLANWFYHNRPTGNADRAKQTYATIFGAQPPTPTPSPGDSATLPAYIKEADCNLTIEVSRV